MLIEMKVSLSKYLDLQSTLNHYKNMPAYQKSFLERLDSLLEENRGYGLHEEQKRKRERQDQADKTPILNEDFEDGTLTQLYQDVWEVLLQILEREYLTVKRKKEIKTQEKHLNKLKKEITVVSSLKNNKNLSKDLADDKQKKGFKHVYKTILCPFKLKCPQLKK